MSQIDAGTDRGVLSEILIGQIALHLSKRFGGRHDTVGIIRSRIKDLTVQRRLSGMWRSCWGIIDMLSRQFRFPEVSWGAVGTNLG